MILVVLLIIEVVVSLGIGAAIYLLRGILYVTWLKDPLPYMAVWGARALLVLVILVAVILRNLRFCRLFWLGHLPIVLITMFTSIPLLQTRCTCNDYWNCQALASFTKLGENFVNPFVAPEEQMAQQQRNFGIQKPPDENQTGLTQLQATVTLEVNGSRKFREVELKESVKRHFKPPKSQRSWAFRTDLVKSQDGRLSSRFCDSLPEEYQQSSPNLILTHYVEAARHIFSQTEKTVNNNQLDNKLRELSKLCHEDATQTLCKLVVITFSLNKADDGNRMLCMEWDTARTRSQAQDDSEVENSRSLIVKEYGLSAREVFQDKHIWQQMTATKISSRIATMFNEDCRCDSSLNPYGTCNVYYDDTHSERFWCYIDSSTRGSCRERNFKLHTDEKGIWTEDLCRKIHNDGDGCQCAGFGMKLSSIKGSGKKKRSSAKNPAETDSEEPLRQEWRYGHICKDWDHNQEEFCFVGFDTTCPDRSGVKFAFGGTQGTIYSSKLPCAREKFKQTQQLRNARESCTHFTWFALCGILWFNLFCAWESLAIYYFIGNRCSDVVHLSSDQFAAESDDEDTWDVTTA